ncbi:exo-alpha-sialidase [Collimonas fungivorans]|uniref:exo-alpha-sialidase n=1 Tax=Collimonas fungivorans TaxID=158899 RepID=UPI003FA3806E
MKLKNTMLVLVAALSAIGAQAQNKAGYKWDTVPIGGGGYVSGVYPQKGDAKVAYARTDVGGAYRWDNGAGRWVALNDALTQEDAGILSVDSLAVDQGWSSHILMLAGNQNLSGGRTYILHSTDAGASFEKFDVTAQFKTDGNYDGRQAERLVFDPVNSKVAYVGTRANGLFKSNDWGRSWTRLNLDVWGTYNGGGINLVAVDPSSAKNGFSQRLIIGVSRGNWGNQPNLYRSDDAGASFYPISSNDTGVPNWFQPQRAVFDDQGVAYITYSNGIGPYPAWRTPELIKSDPLTQGGVWKYYANNWWFKKITPTNMGDQVAFGGISVDPTNRKRLIASTLGQYRSQGGGGDGEWVYLSTDGGDSWRNVLGPNSTKSDNGVAWIKGAGIHWGGTVAFDPTNPQAAWITSGNGLFKTSNLGDANPNWSFEVKGLEETVVMESVSKPGGPLITVLGDIGTFVHTNTAAYGTMPASKTGGGTTTGLAMASGNTSNWARVGSQGLQYSVNGGMDWVQAAETKSIWRNNGWAYRGKVALSSNGSILLHSPEGSNATYRSENWGGGWAQANGLNVSNAYPFADATDSAKFYAYDSDNGNFWISTNSAWNFYTSGTVLPKGGSKRIGIPPGINGHVWVPLYDGGLMRTSDSGNTFIKLNNVTKCGAIGFGKVADGKWYPTIFIWGTVGGVTGVFRSTDIGETWLRINDDQHQYANYGGVLTGDMNAFGVVYMGTPGRGLAVGRP